MMWRVLIWQTCSLIIALLSTSAMAATREWDFRVSLDQKVIGTHRYILESDGANRKLSSDASYDYKWLGISVYKYTHHAEETWSNDCIAMLNSTSVTNGNNEYVQAQRIDQSLHVDHQGKQASYEGCIKSFAYWNPAFLSETRLLNSQTGEYVPVSITKMNSEMISVRGSSTQSDRYQVRGKDLQIDLWYVNGDWVALQALTDKGRMLRYELR